MSEEQNTDLEVGSDLSKESLFPDGMPGTREWGRHVRKEREAALNGDIPPEPEAAAEGEEEIENPAEAQGTQSGEGEQETAPEAALGRMRLKDFLNAAGVTMEEFYRDVVVERDGVEVPVSQAWDDYRTLTQARDDLLRERSELQEKVSKSSMQVPAQQISPEAQQLMLQAQQYQQALMQPEYWQGMDPAQAVATKQDYMIAAQQLAQQAQAKQAEWQQKQTEKYRQALEEADRETRKAIPQWNDTAIREAEWRGIGDMLSTYGINEQELQQVVDPRWRRLLRDAMQSRAQSQRIQQGVQKIRKVGKTVSPGARNDIPTTPTLDGAHAALKAARQGGADKEQMTRERLRVPLPDIKPVKRGRQ